MATKPETRLQKKIQDLVRARGGWAGKIHGGIYSSGIPDLLICYLGVFIALEVKTPENKKGATKLQAAQLRQIRRAGGLAYVVRSVRDVERILGHVERLYGKE
jgi:hypothetical protein